MTKRVLVVDDEADLADAITLTLQSQGIPAVTAYDGKDALYEFHRAIYEHRHVEGAPEPFAAIVLDLALPEVSGFVVGQNIRNVEKHLKKGRTFIIAWTAYGDSVDRDLLALVEPDAYMHKPEPKSGDLLAAVMKALGVEK